MLVAPPIGTTKTPSRSRSRPRRAASVRSAAWSLMPSTSTTEHAPAAGSRARAAAATSAALLPPAASVIVASRASDSSSTFPSLA